MPWIPSHSELKDHPKTRKAAAMLNVSRAAMVGHLHCLWWWAMTYAPDGMLEKWDVLDLALAAEWEHDPDKFVHALVDCGEPGFIEKDPCRLHDWDEYGGRLAEFREDGARGNHIRWHVSRGVVDTSCPYCMAGLSGGESGGESGGDRPPYPEKRREEKKKNPLSSADAERRADVDGLCDLLVELVEGNGCRRPEVNKGWRASARLLLDKDGVEVGEAERVMRWALADDFWRTNVLSMPTFRKQFDRLRLQSQNGKKSSQGFATDSTGTVYG